jgi:hypothetical protein
MAVPQPKNVAGRGWVMPGQVWPGKVRQGEAGIPFGVTSSHSGALAGEDMNLLAVIVDSFLPVQAAVRQRIAEKAQQGTLAIAV